MFMQCIQFRVCATPTLYRIDTDGEGDAEHI